MASFAVISLLGDANVGEGKDVDVGIVLGR